MRGPKCRIIITSKHSRSAETHIANANIFRGFIVDCIQPFAAEFIFSSGVGAVLAIAPAPSSLILASIVVGE